MKRMRRPAAIALLVPLLILLPVLLTTCNFGSYSDLGALIDPGEPMGVQSVTYMRTAQQGGDTTGGKMYPDRKISFSGCICLRRRHSTECFSVFRSGCFKHHSSHIVAIK